MSQGRGISPLGQDENKVHGDVISPLSLTNEIKQGYANLSSTFTVRQRKKAEQIQIPQKIDQLIDLLVEQNKQNRKHFIIATIIAIAAIIIGILLRSI